MNYAQHYSIRKTPQSEPIPGSAQVKNDAGGYVWAVDKWKRLDRFLVLGTEGATYYASEHKMTRENADSVVQCIKDDGRRAVDRIVEISKSGRAPKNEPALFALALAMSFGEDGTPSYAADHLHDVARTGTHLFHLVAYLEEFRGWGRVVRRAIANWYGMPPEKLAYQVVKYRQRDGWTHRDVLRLAHVRPNSERHNAIFNYVTHGLPKDKPVEGEYLERIVGYELAQLTTDTKELVNLIEKYDLSWEMLPTGCLKEPAIWKALIPNMGLTALIRNLGRMTAIGLFKPMSDEVALVCGYITSTELITKSRVHPVSILSAITTYQQGHGEKGHLEWTPNAKIIDALNDAFYKAFQNVEPSGRRILLAVDVSGSMCLGTIAGVPGLLPIVGGAAMALVTEKTEPNAYIFGVDTQLYSIDLSSHNRLDDVVSVFRHWRGGGTDLSLPMQYAAQEKIPIDAFVFYTDSQSWYGGQRPYQALQGYRRKMNIPAKLIVVSMTATQYSIGNDEDANVMECVGFDTATPQLISDFIAEKF